MIAGAAVGGPASVYAQDTTTTQPATSGSTELETIEVTGTRLRRVDVETASPIYTIDRATIEASGVTTLGQLIQEAPSISGAATNPQVNNGGGTGAAVVSLRGLGEERTLILLNGRRLGAAFDVNSIPINLIDRVEILKEGAGAIYGSDAVGGVVNFITRKDITGGNIAAQFGQSTHKDGQNQSYDVSVGIAGPQGNLLLGMNYNKQKQVSAASREFSKHALYVYNYYGTDTVIILGSSRNPQGRIFLPAQSFETSSNTAYDPTAPQPRTYDCRSNTSEGRVAAGGGSIATDQISVSLTPGQTGGVVGDYRCYSGARDAFDYQPFNLVVTPQERASIFTLGNYKINDQLEFFTDLFHNFTQSGFQIAPLPFDARSDNVVISANNIYNPFGIDLGGHTDNPGDPLNPNFLTRFVTNGNRFSNVETNTDQISSGLRGDLFATTWKWDLGLTYQQLVQKASVSGYVRQTDLQDALGPSFVDDNGTPADPTDDVNRCGAPGAVIVGCTPINIFDTADPNTVAQLARLATGYDNDTHAATKIGELTFNGDLFHWAPGTAQAAVGLDYKEDSLKVDVDELTQAVAPRFDSCAISQETCSGDTQGTEKVWELFGETLIPLVSDVPGVTALNATVGLRHSDYDSFGTTDNMTGKLEYRPIKDLLARVSYAQVFRAPTIFDRFGAPATSNPLFFDPCVGLTAADVTANPNLALACQNVAQDGSFPGAPTPQVAQLITSNPNLDPEKGHVLTGGVVYDPNWLPDFSVSADYWYYKIKDAIIAPDVQTIADTCVETGDPTVCGLIDRFSDGQINRIVSPTFNSAQFTTSGLDFGVKYNLRGLPFGTFRLGVDVTRTMDFKYRILPGSQQVDAAGTYDSQFGHFAKWRGQGTIGWAMAGAEVLWTTRYIDGVDIASSFGQGSGRPAASGPIHIGAVAYTDLSAGYTVPGTQTKLTLGAHNLFDKQPPLFYQYALNANTVVETYDAMGAFFYARISQSF